MADNNLRFSLVIDADTRNLVQNIQKSEAAMRSFLELVRRESSLLQQTTGSTTQQINRFSQQINSTASSSQNFDTQLNTLNRDMQSVTQSATQTTSGIDSVRNSFGNLGHILAGLGIGITASELAKTADEYKSLSARLQLSIGEHGDLAKVMSEVSSVAMRTNSNLAATADLYSKISKAASDMNKKQTAVFQYAGLETKQINIQQKDILSLTESINKATQITGASAEATSSSLYQLGQSLSSGVLRGEEYNSVLEGTPRIIQAVADGLGVGIGQLKAMADAGQLTTDVWLPAFLSQTSKLNAEFAKFPTTIGGAIENVKTAWSLYVGEVDNANSISSKVANSILYIAEHLDELGATLKTAIEMMIAYKAIGLAKYLSEKATAFSVTAQAIRNNTTQVISSTQAETANTQARQANAQANTNQTRTALQLAQANATAARAAAEEMRQEVASANSKLQNIQATRQLILADIQLEQQRLKAQITDIGRQKTYTRMAELGRINAQVVRELAVAENELNAVRARATIAANNYTSANRALSDATPTLTQRLGGVGNVLMSGVSKLGMYGAAVGGTILSVKLLADTLESAGKSIGENAAKWVLHWQNLKTADELEKELAKQQEESKKKSEQLQEARRREAASAELSKRAALGLNDATKSVVDNFDKAVKGGESVEKALKGVAEAFSFDSTTGINNGITALLALEKQGKASASEIKKALSGALEGQDLLVFETNASTVAAKLQDEMDKAYAVLEQKKQAYDAWHSKATYSEIEANKAKQLEIVEQAQATYNTLQTQHNNAVQGMSQVQEATLDAAIKRTGLSYEELSGKSTESYRIASNNIEIVAKNLDKLREKGVDVGQAVGITIQNTIKEATNQDELDNIKSRVESLRTVLGDKIADGLLDQLQEQGKKVKKTFDDLVPGINSVEEAARKLGIKTKAELKDVADESLKNFKAIANSGLFTQQQLKEAVEKMIADAKKSGDQVAISAANAAASMGGLITETDKAGNVIVKTSDEYMNSLGKISNSANQAKSVFLSIGDSAEDAADRTASAFEKAGESISSSLSKAKSGMTEVNAQTWVNAKQIEDKLKSKGYTDEEAKHYAEKIYNDSKGSDMNGATKASLEYMKRRSGGYADSFALSRPTSSNTGYVEEQLEKFEGMIASRKQSEAISRVAEETPNRITETKRIQLMADNHQVEFDIHQSQENSLDAMLNQLAMAKKRY